MSNSVFYRELHLPIENTVVFGNYELVTGQVYLIEGILYSVDEDDNCKSLKPTEYENRRSPNLVPEDIKYPHKIYPVGKPLKTIFKADKGQIIAVKHKLDSEWCYREFIKIDDSGCAICRAESVIDSSSWEFYSLLSDV